MKSHGDRFFALSNLRRSILQLLRSPYWATKRRAPERWYLCDRPQVVAITSCCDYKVVAIAKKGFDSASARTVVFMRSRPKLLRSPSSYLRSRPQVIAIALGFDRLSPNGGCDRPQVIAITSYCERLIGQRRGDRPNGECVAPSPQVVAIAPKSFAITSCCERLIGQRRGERPNGGIYAIAPKLLDYKLLRLQVVAIAKKGFDSASARTVVFMRSPKLFAITSCCDYKLLRLQVVAIAKKGFDSASARTVVVMRPSYLRSRPSCCDYKLLRLQVVAIALGFDKLSPNGGSYAIAPKVVAIAPKLLRSRPSCCDRLQVIAPKLFAITSNCDRFGQRRGERPNGGCDRAQVVCDRDTTETGREATQCYN
ncbi:MAG: hypothetical protein F6J93_09450 [Oscillatoria sp. SIO1A7]|nr:hypothetical protein [Oscillatoria sp. SIO1A7]